MFLYTRVVRNVVENIPLPPGDVLQQATPESERPRIPVRYFNKTVTNPATGKTFTYRQMKGAGL